MTKRANLDSALAELLSKEQSWADNPSKVWGADTGFASINRVTGGLHPGLTVLGARTSHGKSALGMQVVTNIATSLVQQWQEGDTPPGKVLVFSPEMNPDELMERYATTQSRVPLKAIKTGSATEEQRQQWRDWADTMLALDPVLDLYAGSNVSYQDIENVLEKTQDDGVPIRLVFIDYLQRISGGRTGSGSSSYDEISRMAGDLKSLANRERIPFLVASQLNRGIEKDNQGALVERPPDLSDLSGSGKIEEASDMVWLLWRPPAAPAPDSGPNRAQPATVYVKKNRHGELGEAHLRYYPRLVLFEDDPRKLEQEEAA